MCVPLCIQRQERLVDRLDVILRTVLKLLQACEIREKFRCQGIESDLVFVGMGCVAEIVDHFKQRVDLLSRPVFKGRIFRNRIDHCFSDAVKDSFVIMRVRARSEVLHSFIQRLKLIGCDMLQ